MSAYGHAGRLMEIYNLSWQTPSHWKGEAVPYKKKDAVNVLPIVTEDGSRLFTVRYVESSNIEWIGWPQTGEPLMMVNFKGGSRYGYIGVSRQRAVACALARSCGEYLARRIKPNYKVVQIR